MKLRISTTMRMVTALAAILLVLGLPLAAAELENPQGLSFRYEKSAEGAVTIHLHEVAIKPIRDAVYVYATVEMGPANPIGLVGGVPQWRPQGEQAVPVPKELDQAEALGGFVVQKQEPIPEGRPQFLEVVTLGAKTSGQFVPVIRFGLADDRRAQDKAHVTAWVSDGKIDYFAQYARPNTPYDFKIHLDLKRKRLTAWVRGRGDDDWFLLAEDVPLASAVPAVDSLKVEMYPDGPPISRLRVQSSPWEAGEQILPHPLAKKDRTVGPDKGFQFQSMRSTWRKPGKHVTIFREPGVHAAFTDVAQAGPNHLVCVWRNGSHTGGAGGLSLAHSYDLGKTWSKPVLVTSLGGNCPRVQRLKDGKLLLLVDVASGGDQFTATWDLVLWDSVDGGKTWINERRLETNKVGGGGCIVPSRICEMADGAWLLAASTFTTKQLELLDYYRSEDRGKTWHFLGAPNHYPPHSLSEPSPIQLSDGRLIVYARESRADGMPGAKGYSKDGGKTWQYQELPHPINGRTCAGFLKDGRVMITFRSGVGRAALRAWIGDVNDPTEAQPAGGHFNDTHSVGLKDGALHIDNDGLCGQFTKYTLRPPDTAETTVELTFEVKVPANQGRAATVSIPFAGQLRLFPDHVVLAHDPSLRVPVTPGEFHVYRVVSRVGKMQLYVDGKLQLDTDKADSELVSLPWVQTSVYSLSFGNESKGTNATGEVAYANARPWPDVYAANITPAVTGYSVWRRFGAVLDDPKTGKQTLAWSAEKDGFPDQYQLDHIIEVEASASGHEQGYSGWTQLDDGRIFVVHYTDDTSAASTPNPHNFGVPWIRGTFLQLDDLPRHVLSQ